MPVGRFTEAELQATPELLDSLVCSAILNFYDAFRGWVRIDADNYTSHPSTTLFNDALLELAFMADARKQAENDAFSVHNEISWVPVVRDGLREMSQGEVAMRGLHKARLFSPADVAMQAEIYQDMCDRRLWRSDEPLPDDHGLEYAACVAWGKIILERETGSQEMSSKAQRYSKLN